MDLVDSVTQNSNNTKVTMENLPPGPSYGLDGADDDNNDSNNNNNNNSNGYSSPSPSSSSSTSMQMQAANSSAGQVAVNNGTPEMQASSAQPLLIKEDAKPQVSDYLKVMGMDPKKFWPKKYRFTREKSPGQHNPLSIAQRNFYENNGYIVIDECSSLRLIEAIRAEYKESSLVSEFLVEKLVAKNGKLLQYAKCFCDERLMLMTHKLVETFQSNEQAKAIMDNKKPQQRQQLFRDWIYLPFRPIDKVVCAITAIEPLDHVILVVPGTHKVGQCTISSTLETISAAYETSQERSSNQLRSSIISKELFESSPENLSALVEKSHKGFKYVNLKPGQTLFYHPGLVHGFSDDLVNFRKRQLATIAYYAAADCEYVEMRRQQDDSSLLSSSQTLPISLAHFNEQDPSDFNSWINRPRLIGQDLKANL